MFVIAIDTETFWNTKTVMNQAFIATTTDQMLQTRLYELRRDDITKWDEHAIKQFLDFAALKHICEDPNTLKIFHNAPYDIGCLEQVEIFVVPPYEDTMIMASIVNENFSSKKLKELAKKYLHEKCEEEAALKKVIASIKRYNKKMDDEYEFSYEDIPFEILYPYAKQDSVYTIKLYYLFKNPLAEFRKLYEDIELPIIEISCEMTRNGLRVDRDFVGNKIIDFVKLRDKELEKIFEEINILGIKFYKKGGTKNNPKLTEVKFNPRSPNHLVQLWVFLNLPVLKRTKPSKKHPEGNICTDKNVLQEFIENQENVDKYNVKVLSYIARYKFLDKQLNTYLIPLYLHYTNEEHDRAHFQLWQSGAKTGRFSGELIQTMPKVDQDRDESDVRVVRYAFIPAEDHVLCFIDYEQIELRLFAHNAHSDILTDLIVKGLDPHLNSVYVIFPKHIVDISPLVRDTLRGMLKHIVFGIIYGMGKKKLLLRIRDIVYRIAKLVPAIYDEMMAIANNPGAILQTYYSKFPVMEYQRRIVSELYRRGNVEISFDSALMKFRRVYRTPHHLAYKAVNMIVQGTAAYVMKTGMIRTYRWIKENPQYEIKLLLTVHDELVFEIPKAKPYVAIMYKLQELMEDKVTFSIPIEASIKATEKNWGEAYTMARDGYCKKHGKLPIPDRWGITYCDSCKKRYFVVPYSEDTLKRDSNGNIRLEPYRGELTQ
jgi:DNA polymerase-1